MLLGERSSPQSAFWQAELQYFTDLQRVHVWSFALPAFPHLAHIYHLLSPRANSTDPRSLFKPHCDTLISANEGDMETLSEIRRLKALDKEIVEIASWLAPAKLLNPTMASRRRAWERFRTNFARRIILDPVFEYTPLPTQRMAA